MKRNSNDYEMKQLLDHHAFVVRTDRKSLHAQIKSLVQQAQEVALKELNQRRQTLQALLEKEHKLYEEEFANKVKSRLVEDTKERKEILLKIKEESTRKEQEFLKSKRAQQYMNSCYEIREALRLQETQQLKRCQLEQMLEKDRTLQKEQEVQKYWQRVQLKNMEVANKRQQEEDHLKKTVVKRVSDILKVQMGGVEEKREKLRHEKLEEKQELDELLEKIRLEELNRKLQGKPAKVLEYRQELLSAMAEKQKIRDKELADNAQKHCQMIDTFSDLEAREAQACSEKKKAFHKATLDFIDYVKGVRELNLQQQHMYDKRIEELRRLDTCTKNNIQRERQRKARLAEECYAELRKQICEQHERRLRDEAEKRESKILENRFVRDEITHDQMLEQKRKNREGLDQQIAEIKRIREAEELKFNRDLRQASNDPEYCSELVQQYFQESFDYLEPHPNWKYIGKAVALDKDGCGDKAKKSFDGRGDEKI